MKIIKVATLVIFVSVLSGCGTFNLGNVVSQPSKTTSQQQLDTLTCKDQARLSTDSASNQTKDFLLGMTIVGAPLAFELDKQRQREVFTSCMKDYGYTVLPAKD